MAHTNEDYDLVVVGAGMSGLSAAYFFLKNTARSVRLLILDNHDDFGGHAKRNEFRHNGKLLAINGGTLNIEAPQRYFEDAKALLHDIGVDLERFQASNRGNRELYRLLGLRNAYFFDKETWGADRLVLNPTGSAGRGRGFSQEFLLQAPLSAQAQKDLLRLYDNEQPDYLPGLSSAERKVRLAKMSYKDFLLSFAKVDPEVYWFFQHFGEGNFCVGGDATKLFAWEMGQPGFGGLHLEPNPNGVLEELAGVQHGRQVEAPGPSCISRMGTRQSPGSSSGTSFRRLCPAKRRRIREPPV